MKPVARLSSTSALVTELFAYRCLEAAGSEAAADAGMASDQYLFGVAVVGQGMLARVCHRLNKENTKRRKEQHYTQNITRQM